MTTSKTSTPTTKKMKKLVVMAAVLACGVPAFAFTAGQTPAQVNAEVASRASNGESLAAIAAAAKAANVPVATLAGAMASAGDSSAVLAALMGAGFDAAASVNALVAVGGDRAALVATAISNGADPTTITAATAACGNPTAAGNAAPGFSGFSGNSGFSQSRASSVGGAGNSSTAPSASRILFNSLRSFKNGSVSLPFFMGDRTFAVQKTTVLESIYFYAAMACAY